MENPSPETVVTLVASLHERLRRPELRDRRVILPILRIRTAMVWSPFSADSATFALNADE